jgi:hypothetical protein
MPDPVPGGTTMTRSVVPFAAWRWTLPGFAVSVASVSEMGNEVSHGTCQSASEMHNV